MTIPGRGSGEEPEEPASKPSGHLRPTRPASLVVAFLIGLLLGRLVRPLTLALDQPTPRVGWLPPSALLLVAAIIGYAAWATHRALQPRVGELRSAVGLRPHQAVNRLVLAKSCALSGAVVLGGYLGFALSWLGDESEIAGERIAQSLVAALGGGLIVAGSLLLERACRVKPAGDRP